MHGEGERWLRVSHVTVNGSVRSQKRSILPWISLAIMTLFVSLAILIPALLLVFNLQASSGNEGGMPSHSELASKEEKLRNTVHSEAIHQAIKAAEKRGQGFVQAVRTESKATAEKNVATHRLLEKTREEELLDYSGKSLAEMQDHVASTLVPSPDKNPEKILVKMFMESECPACRKFSTTYVKEMLEAEGVGDIVDFQYVAWGWGVIEALPTQQQLELNPKATAGDNILNHTSQLMPVLKQLETPGANVQILFQCQHGVDECKGNAYESCLQDVGKEHQNFFPVFDCIESRACVEGLSPPACVDKPANVVDRCIREYGQRVNTPEVVECYQGPRMRELLVQNDITTLNAAPQWVPWFTLDGVDLVEKSPSDEAVDEAVGKAKFREQFLLGKAVCDAYTAKTGKSAPAGCAKFPQSDADVGEDPWAKYPAKNFTVLIDEISAERLKKEAAVKWVLQEEASPWAFFKFKLLAIVVIVGMAAAVFHCFCKRNSSEEASKGDTDTEPLVGKQEHV